MPKTYKSTLFILLSFCGLLSYQVVHACPDTAVISVHTNVSCIGLSDGSATVIVTTTPHGSLSYQWNTSPVQTNATVTGLSAGTYSVQVIDSTGLCTCTASVTIVNPPYTISDFAGNGSGTYSNGIPATTTGLKTCFQITMDGAGDLYIADAGNSAIRKVTPAGIITTVAGKDSAGFSGDNGPATAAKFNFPSGIALDAAGDLYIADEYNNRIRKVDTHGTITTIAGTGTAGFSGDGGDATAADLSLPSTVLLDGSGNNLYISDVVNECIRKIDLGTGKISTYAGIGTDDGYSGVGGPATAAEMYDPHGMCLDAAGNLYVADYTNNVIREIDYSSGDIYTIAGDTIGYDYVHHTNPGAYSGDGGAATAAKLNAPWGVAVDKAGNIYIADGANHVIREVSGGVITTIAGMNSHVGYSGDGGLALDAEMSQPVSIIVDASYNIYFSDSYISYVRKLYACPYCTAAAKVTTGLVCSTDVNGVLTATSPAGEAPYIYTWSNGATTATISNLSAGTYTVNINDSLACNATATATLSGIGVQAAITGPDSLCKGDMISLTATGGSSYLWNNGKTTPTIDVSPIGDSTYIVTVYSGTCKDSATHNIYVATDGNICIIKFYTGITPNGDGHNDTWQIDNIDLYPDNTVEIYNRWGSDVWDATGYNNTTVVWRGDDHRGKPLPDGTYYYLAKINGRSYKGWVQLTR